MANLWIFLGIAGIAASAGAAAINLTSNNSTSLQALSNTHTASDAASSPRQQMARVIAETAARSAAQTAKALIAGAQSESKASNALVQASVITPSTPR